MFRNTLAVDADFVVVSGTLRPSDIQGLNVVGVTRENGAKIAVQFVFPVRSDLNWSTDFDNRRMAQVGREEYSEGSLLMQKKSANQNSVRRSRDAREQNGFSAKQQKKLQQNNISRNIFCVFMLRSIM